VDLPTPDLAVSQPALSLFHVQDLSAIWLSCYESVTCDIFPFSLARLAVMARINLLKLSRNLIKDNGYRTMKFIGIYSEISKGLVGQKLADGLISPCSGGVPELAEHDISTAAQNVAQMGHEPYVKAMEENLDLDVIIGG
jgi:hypothetical protein